jgi:hypothetical protein
MQDPDSGATKAVFKTTLIFQADATQRVADVRQGVISVAFEMSATGPLIADISLLGAIDAMGQKRKSRDFEMISVLPPQSRH